jgi:alcohol dehydrogenase
MGPGATRLKPGEWVFCDPTVRARDDALALARSGLLSLDHTDIQEFTLARINEAIIHAAAHRGAFQLTVLRP